MKTSSDIHQIVHQVNERLPVHSMWDGFWINKFKRSNLQISCSFDRIYYRNFDLVFKKVVFFNLPHQWRDTHVFGDHILRLSNKDEFSTHHPNFDFQGKHIFAIDLHFDINNVFQKHTYFVVASKVFLFKCEYPDNASGYEYEDPYGEDVGFECKENRVISNEE